MSNEGVIAGYVDRIWRKYRAKRGVQTAGMNCKTRSNETLWLHLSRVSILPLAFLDFSGNYGIILILCGDVQDGKAVKVHIPVSAGNGYGLRLLQLSVGLRIRWQDSGIPLPEIGRAEGRGSDAENKGAE